MKFDANGLLAGLLMIATFVVLWIAL